MCCPLSTKIFPIMQTLGEDWLEGGEGLEGEGLLQQSSAGHGDGLGGVGVRPVEHARHPLLQGPETQIGFEYMQAQERNLWLRATKDKEEEWGRGGVYADFHIFIILIILRLSDIHTLVSAPS